MKGGIKLLSELSTKAFVSSVYLYFHWNFILAIHKQQMAKKCKLADQ